MELIKHIKLLEGYELKLFYKGEERLSYTFTDPNGEIIFNGNDFGPSPMHCIDSYDSVFSLLGFLTLKSGDVEKEYFADYTEKQLEFRDNEAENLSLYPNDFEYGYITTFIDIDIVYEEERYLVFIYDTEIEENIEYKEAFETVIDMGIDSRLEGFTKSEFNKYDKTRFELKFGKKDIPILIRRLKEKGYNQISEWIEGIKL